MCTCSYTIIIIWLIALLLVNVCLFFFVLFLLLFVPVSSMFDAIVVWLHRDSFVCSIGTVVAFDVVAFASSMLCFVLIVSDFVAVDNVSSTVLVDWLLSRRCRCCCSLTGCFVTLLSAWRCDDEFSSCTVATTAAVLSMLFFLGLTLFSITVTIEPPVDSSTTVSVKRCCKWYWWWWWWWWWLGFWHGNAGVTKYVDPSSCSVYLSIYIEENELSNNSKKNCVCCFLIFCWILAISSKVRYLFLLIIWYSISVEKPIQVVEWINGKPIGKFEHGLFRAYCLFQEKPLCYLFFGLRQRTLTHTHSTHFSPCHDCRHSRARVKINTILRWKVNYKLFKGKSVKNQTCVVQFRVELCSRENGRSIHTFCRVQNWKHVNASWIN